MGDQAITDRLHGLRPTLCPAPRGRADGGKEASGAGSSSRRNRRSDPDRPADQGDSGRSTRRRSSALKASAERCRRARGRLRPGPDGQGLLAARAAAGVESVENPIGAGAARTSGSGSETDPQAATLCGARSAPAAEARERKGREVGSAPAGGSASEGRTPGGPRGQLRVGLRSCSRAPHTARRVQPFEAERRGRVRVATAREEGSRRRDPFSARGKALKAKARECCRGEIPLAGCKVARSCAAGSKTSVGLPASEIRYGAVR
jgi:hypothetical protein